MAINYACLWNLHISCNKIIQKIIACFTKWGVKSFKSIQCIILKLTVKWFLLNYHLRRQNICSIKFQSHFAAERSSMFAMIQLHKIPVNDSNEMTGKSLHEALEKDKQNGLIPLLIGAFPWKVYLIVLKLFVQWFSKRFLQHLEPLQPVLLTNWRKLEPYVSILQNTEI